MLNIADKIVEKANMEWPLLFNELPIMPANRDALIQHWRKLKSPFSMVALANILSNS